MRKIFFAYMKKCETIHPMMGLTLPPFSGTVKEHLVTV
jgi:hypothetical protein